MKVKDVVHQRNPFAPIDMSGCVLHIPFWAYGSEQTKAWDISGQNNHGTITGAVPALYPLISLSDSVEDEIGSTFNRGDFTPTNAFLWSSLDLSLYAGTDLGSTPYYIEVLDGAGKKATGYLGAVGAGETLNVELLSNPGFGSDTIWLKSDGTWTIGGGVAIGAASSAYLYQHISHVIRSLIKCQHDVVTYISGTSPQVNLNSIVTIVSDNASGTYSGYMNPVTSDSDFYFLGAAFTGTIDNASAKRVTDPPSTAVHIVSSLNGTVRDWASIESGFNSNTITSWDIYTVTLHGYESIGEGFDGVDDYITIANSTSLNMSSNMTLLMWIRFAYPNTGGGVQAAKIDSDANGWYLNRSVGTFQFVNRNGGVATIQGSLVFPTNQWSCIAFTKSGATGLWYLNGIDNSGIHTDLGSIGAGTTNLYINAYEGGNYSLSKNHTGEVLIFNRALSAQEIRDYHENTRRRYGV